LCWVCKKLTMMSPATNSILHGGGKYLPQNFLPCKYNPHYIDMVEVQKHHNVTHEKNTFVTTFFVHPSVLSPSCR
jgi:hypothetical protein